MHPLSSARDCASKLGFSLRSLSRVAHHGENLVGREAFFGDDAQFLQVF
jgi:hypothetical protein